MHKTIARAGPHPHCSRARRGCRPGGALRDAAGSKKEKSSKGVREPRTGQRTVPRSFSGRRNARAPRTMAFRALRLVAPKLARGYAVEGSGAAPFIVQAFANQQAKFKALSDSSEKLTPPADDAGWSKFASDYNTLKVKVPKKDLARSPCCS